MKKLFWLLVFINLGLLAYFNVSHLLPEKPPISSHEIDAHKIQILSSEQIAALPKKTVKTDSPATVSTPTKSTCYEWGVFSDSDLTNAQSAASRLALKHTLKEQSYQQAKRFWVYIPPLRSSTEAQNRVTELKIAGIEDLFVVEEQKWKNAISFGIFADEQLAIELLNTLKRKGVKEVVKSLRTRGNNHSSLLLRDLNDTELAEINKLKPDFPGADLHKTSCN
ncbi:MAG: SPOR domain-containing protein [Betaproteobacteria bacterium]|nr:SPOR domain-containing protein [Betaproteobacteria bacterium]